jgi:SET domain-containing protein
MLLIKARRGPSSIDGFGLIAQEFIPKGTTMWVFQPNFDQEISEQTFDNFPSVARDYLRTFAYFNTKRKVWILSGDDDRFTNHSDNPNTIDEDMSVIAARDIQIGEEITSNYHDLGETEFMGYSPERKI